MAQDAKIAKHRTSTWIWDNRLHPHSPSNDTRADLPDETLPEAAVARSGTPSPTAIERLRKVAVKLVGPQQVLETAWLGPVLGRKKATSQQLVSTSYDTSDRRLKRRGLSLRLRHDGKAITQTVVADPETENLTATRQEWSAPLDDAVPDLARFDDPALLERIGLILPVELQPQFTMTVTRRTKRYRVAQGGARGAVIEVAFDTGEITGDEWRLPLAELEFRLLEGNPEALYREALKVHEATPLAIETLSKSQRGFAMADGTPAIPRKAVGADLTPAMTTDEAIARVFGDCLSHWLANHAAVLEGLDIEGLHQLRVALRRLRSAVTLFKEILPPDDAAWLQEGAKALLGGLGPARDWDVFQEELLTPVVAAQPGEPSLGSLQVAVEAERRSAQSRAKATLTSPAYGAFALRLAAWLEARGWHHAGVGALEMPLIELADRLIARNHKKALKQGRRFETLPEDDLHRLRITLKKLRYTTEFFASLYPKAKTRSYLKDMRRLQDDLGHLNDVAVAHSRLDELCKGKSGEEAATLMQASGLVLGWYAHALAKVRPEIAADWHAFADRRRSWRD